MTTHRTMRWLVVVAALLSLQVAARAQSSPSYRLDEHSLNAGGRPMDGVVSTSPSFRISVEAIGALVARRDLSGTSYRMDGGFTPALRPPGEVAGLQVLVDQQTVTWLAEPASATFNVYSGPIAALPGTYGGCAVSRVSGTSWADPSLPSPGSGLFYLVTGENRLREEGTKGRTSSGVARSNPAPCP